MLFTVSTDQYAPGDSARDAPSLQTPRQLLEYCFPKCHRCYKTDTLSNDCFFHTIEPIAAFRDPQFETRLSYRIIYCLLDACLGPNNDEELDNGSNKCQISLFW